MFGAVFHTKPTSGLQSYGPKPSYHWKGEIPYLRTPNVWKFLPISLLKTAFGGIPSLETNFGGIDCWMFAPIKSEKMSADFGGIARNFGGIARNFGGIIQTQIWLQISTAHENPILAELNIVGIFLFSVDILEFGDSCAEM